MSTWWEDTVAARSAAFSNDREYFARLVEKMDFSHFPNPDHRMGAIDAAKRIADMIRKS